MSIQLFASTPLCLMATWVLASGALVVSSNVARADSTHSQDHDMSAMKGMTGGSQELHQAMMKGMKAMQAMKKRRCGQGLCQHDD